MADDYQEAEEAGDDDVQLASPPSIHSAPPQSIHSAPPQSSHSAPPPQSSHSAASKPAPRATSTQDKTARDTTQNKNGQGSAPTRHRRQGPRKPPPCNCRIDELARPKRWIILNTWKDHGSHFDPERSQALREKVQEEFCMTPEETAAYLAQSRQHQQKSRQNDRVYKAEQRKEAKAARRAADLFVQKRIKRGLMYAYQNPPPLLMSPMLRSISDRVLEELCVLHDVPIPKRGDTDKHSRYLLSAADWTAIQTANIYYEVNVKEKEDIDRMLEADRWSYVESEEAIPEKSEKGKKELKQEKKKQKEPGRASADQFAPSEKQMGVTNYGNSEFGKNQKEEPEPEEDMYELDRIDEEGG